MTVEQSLENFLISAKELLAVVLVLLIESCEASFDCERGAFCHLKRVRPVNGVLAEDDANENAGSLMFSGSHSFRALILRKQYK